VEATDTEKHCSLPRGRISYGRKKFYSTGPGCKCW